MKKIIGLILLFTMPVQAVILSTDQLETILEYCNKGTLVVFDVDETLIETSAQRYPQLMQENVPALLEQIANKGAKMVALTARKTEYLTDTIQQLKNVGISFDDHCPIRGRREDYEDTYACDAGVICCGSSDKAEILEQFVLPHIDACTPYDVRNLVFVDDRLDNVQAVEAMFRATQATPFIDDIDMPMTVKSVLYTKNIKNRLKPEMYEAFGKIMTEFIRVQDNPAQRNAFLMELVLLVRKCVQ